ncbi:MAG: hypothetical protein OHK0017_00280 [Patescibacteria group bacterium]
MKIVSWTLRTAVVNSIHVFSVDTLSNLTKNILLVPFETKIHRKIDPNHALNFILKKETVISLGRSALFATLLFLPAINYVFPLIAILSLIYFIV